MSDDEAGGEWSVPRAFEFLRQYGILLAFLVLAAGLAASAPHFLTWINLLNTLESGAIYGIVAVALTVLLILGQFDFSAGATFVLAGIVAAKIQPAVGNWPSLLAGLVTGLLIGAFNGTAISLLRVNSFVATLATSLIVVGIGIRVTEGFQLYISDPAFGTLGNAKLLAIDLFVWIFLGLSLLVTFVLSQAQFGRWLHASGDAPETARLLGINVGKVRTLAFIFSGAAAGLAGVILVSRTGTAIAGDGLGNVLFPAFAAVVIGGTSIAGGRGAVWRTLVGVFFLELVRNGFNLLEVDSSYQSILEGAVILLAVAADSLGRR